MSAGFRQDVEKSSAFSIARMAPWDFWAAAGQVVVPANVPTEVANQIIVMKAIALRDAETASERRN